MSLSFGGMKNTLLQLDQRLGALLGPPFVDESERAAWRVTDGSVPVVERWVPPFAIPGADGGFGLSNNVLCYQRGYVPDLVMSTVSNLHPIDPSNNMYDFVLLVHVEGVVCGFCLLEFRCTDPKKAAPSYLFLSELFVRETYRRKRIGHQLVHACYTMGIMMIERNASRVWDNAIRGSQLFLCAKADSAKQMSFYNSCGLVGGFRPVTRYESISGGQNWNLEQMGDGILSQIIVPGTVFRDGSISILSNAQAGAKLFYFGFIGERVDEIRRNGLVLTSHNGMGIGESGVQTFDSIVFSDVEPASGGVIVLNVSFMDSADSLRVHNINLGVSIPPWFAFNIYVKS